MMPHQTHRIVVYLDADTLARLAAAASDEGLTRSAWLRRVALTELRDAERDAEREAASAWMPSSQ